VVAPAAIAARQTSARNCGSDRVAASAENSTPSTRPCAYATAARACSSTSAGSRRSFRSMWIGLVAMNVCSRVRCAPPTASIAASTSSRLARFARGVDVAAARPRERGDRCVPRHSRNCPDPLEVTGRGNRKARLDHVDAEPLEMLRDLRFLVRLKRYAGQLLALARRRGEDCDPACHDAYLLAGPYDVRRPH